MRRETKTKIIMGIFTIGGHIIGASVGGAIIQSPLLENQSPFIQACSAGIIDGMYTSLGWAMGKIVCSEIEDKENQNGTSKHGVSEQLGQES